MAAHASWYLGWAGPGPFNWPWLHFLPHHHHQRAKPSDSHIQVGPLQTTPIANACNLTNATRFPCSPIKVMVGCLKRKRSDPETHSRPGKTKVHEGAVKRHLLTQSYTSVLTLREYALLRLPSGSRLRRKKIKFLGHGDDTTDIEKRISSFLDSTLICSCNAISQDDDATFEQWLSFSQKGDDSHVTLSSGIPDAANTQSEVCSSSRFSLTEANERALISTIDR